MSIMINKYELNYFRFKKNNNKYLITNDIGDYIFLSEKDFNLIKEENIKLSTNLYKKLKKINLVISKESNEELVNSYRTKYAYLNEGPGLHIIVVTLRCDHNCLYCHASRKNINDKKYDMDISTGRKIVDFLLNSSSNNIRIEFQGGEPLLNFEVIKDIIEYVKGKNRDKNIVYSIVTNFSFMDDNKLDYLLKNNVSICTSLDGIESIHNNQRILKETNSYNNTIHWIKRINNLRNEKKNKFNKVNALLTTTSKTFKYFKEIIDLYIELGFSSVFLRPLNPFGYAKNTPKTLIYSSEDFIEYYINSLEYIVELNKSGVIFKEYTAKILLTKILLKIDSNYLDLRSPCGAGIGQLAYNYNGDIYSCDEGRMVSEMGFKQFLLGNVNSTDYKEVMNSDIISSMCISSCLEGIPGCHDCVYNPYCGLCPIYNYIEQGSIFGQMPTNERCKIIKGILDFLFLRIQDKDYKKIFQRWIIY
jgi:uncharacterized protein